MITALAILMGIGLVVLGLEFWLATQLREQQHDIESRMFVLEQGGSRARMPQLRRDSKLNRHFSPLPEKSILNDFELPSLRGGKITLSQWRGQRIAIVFVQPECPHSRQLLSKLARRPEGGPQVIVISTSGAKRNSDLLAMVPDDVPFLVQEGMELARVWRAGETPAGYFIDAEGVTERRVLHGEAPILAELGFEQKVPTDDQVERLTTPLDRKRFERPGSPEVGVLLPATARDSLAGVYANELTTTSGHTLIVFYDSKCKPCRDLPPELEARFRRASGEPRLLVISRGDDASAGEVAAAAGLSFQIAATGNGRIARSFGMVETPSAVLLDTDWLVVAPPAIGHSAILSLYDLAIDSARSVNEAVR